MTLMKRRDHQRNAWPGPCKVYLKRAGSFVAGSTVNLSSGGALLRLQRAAQLEPGDAVAVGLADPERPAILEVDRMLEATVVRALQTPDAQTVVAVRFADPRALRKAA